MGTNFEQARALFVPSLEEYTQTLKFYIMDGFVTDHVQILQAISMLYKNLIFFEGDLSRKCKMHKRRINQLKDVEKDLNPNVFMSTLRQLQSELGCIYDDMGDLKMRILREAAAKAPTDQPMDEKT